MNPMSALFTVSQHEVRLSAVTPVRVASIEVDKNVSAHDHEYTEICIVERGQAIHSSERGENLLKTGSVVIVPPGPAHAFGETEQLRVSNVYYLPEWFLWDLNLLWQNEGLIPLFFASYLFRQPQAERVVLFDLTESELRACLHELNDIRAEYDSIQPSSYWVRGAFSKLLVILSRAWNRQIPQLSQFSFRSEVWSALESIDSTIR
jgi:hypothetical protein